METRTAEQIREHYDVEVELADRLRNAPAENRQELYMAVYEELFSRVPHHPQLTKKEGKGERQQKIIQKRRLLDRFLKPEFTVMELGAGDLALSKALADSVARVFAVDISPTIMQSSDLPENVTAVLSDGTTIPLESHSVDVVFSDQLMEHLHPDDAIGQLAEVNRVLKPGGAYICVTPSRLSGPHDVSQHYDRVATGLHLKEYTHVDLIRAFRDANFDQFRAFAGGKGHSVAMPVWFATIVDRIVDAAGSRSLGLFLPVRACLGVNLVGYKAKVD